MTIELSKGNKGKNIAPWDMVGMQGDLVGKENMIRELPKCDLVFAPDNNPVRSLEISNFQ